MLQQTGVGWLTAQTLIPAIAGLLGVAVGGWMQGHHQNKERESAFIKERLRISMLLCSECDVRFGQRASFSLRVSSIAHAEWQAKFAGITDPEVKKAIDTQESPKYEKVFDYNDKQLREETLCHCTRKCWSGSPLTCGLRNPQRSRTTQHWSSS